MNEPSKKKLGELLQEKGLVSEGRVQEAVRLQKEEGTHLGRILVDKGWIREEDLLACLGEQFSLPCICLRQGLYDLEAVSLVERDTARRLEIMPLFKVRDQLSIATVDPQSIPVFDELSHRTGLRIRPVLARRLEIPKSIDEAYADTYGGGTDYVESLEEDFELVESNLPEDYTAIDELAEGSPIINLVNSIIQRAVRDGASDIHIEPSRNQCRVRYRIDGMLFEVMRPKMEVYAAMVSRLKVIANLDIAERRLPQDGRIQVTTRGRTVDLRFSSLPGIFGEKVVMRVLDKNQSILDINKLGMTDANLAAFKGLLKKNHGLILATGPTGSGKSTTLYAAINHLNSLEKNIVTIEDPVEYQVDIVNQNQVKESIGLGFARMLKHILRQDPDIIMVGEIREHETAEIAVQAALTGHLVLSTLHTNDSAGAVTRLLDMGIEPYLLSSALIGVIGQRLVRTVCPSCKSSFLADSELLSTLGALENETLRLSRGRGCSECYDSGYRGRIGVHEILTVDGKLQRLMAKAPTREEIETYVHESGMKTLREDGHLRVRSGLTTVEEIARAVGAV